jgi:hypothetical protein
MLLREGASFDLATRVRTGTAPIGEVMSFVSGLYFRGKLAYARAFARPPAGWPGALVITSCDGLVDVDEAVTVETLRRHAEVDIDEDEERYLAPLFRDAAALRRAAPGAEVVLLGSIATGKYLAPLVQVFGARLGFPADFAGRGDMSRGGLLLRCVDERRELAYVPLEGAKRHGARPPKLTPRRRTSPAVK